VNLASAVTRAVIKQVDLPESVIRWMYHFIRIEVEKGYPAFQPYYNSLSDEYWKEFEAIDKQQDKELTSWYKKSPEARAKSSYDPEVAFTKKFKWLDEKYARKKAFIPSKPEELLIPYTMKLLSVFESIPPIKDRYTGDITGTIGGLLSDGAASHYKLPKHVQDLMSWMTLPDYFYQHEVDIDIPNRFEHSHILGATGTGKTVLLKHLIFKDTKQDASVVAIAPKGDLIPFLLSCPIPEDRIVLIRPQDNIQLNLFDLDRSNPISTVGVINYVLSSLFDIDLSQKQTSLLNYCIRLCLHIPNATIRTLRDLMNRATLPEEYEPYVTQLSKAGQEFFRDQFGHSRTYKETKGEVMWRIDLLLENTMVEKIFCQPNTSVRIAQAIEQKKVILIDTSIESLGENGSKFFGRFFIALLNLASQRKKSDTPVYVYIDEAAQYLDKSVESLLELARESKMGITLAHQQLAQLGDLAPTVMSNTRTKFVGGCSQDDARRMGKEMYVDPNSLAQQQPFEFTVKCRGIKAIHTTYPPKYINSLPKRDVEQFYNAPAVEYPVDDNPELQLVAEDEEKYDVPHDDIEDWHKP